MDITEAIYRFCYERQRRRYSAQVEDLRPCRVIAVGNITTGGTGKTPAVQWVARLLQQHVRVAVVSRGYGGRLSPRGAVVSDGKHVMLTAEEAGDEPTLHARSLPGVPVLIGRDRAAWARCARDQFGAEVVVLDDAFQYWSLRRDLDIVLLDARRPFDNGHLLPRGRLREPAEALRRAQVILLTRSDLCGPEQRTATRAAVRRFSQAPVFEACHRAARLRDEATGASLDVSTLAGKRVGAVSALADNTYFAVTLKQSGADTVAHLQQRDHHRWRQSELQSVARPVHEQGGVAILTTEKDAVKIDPYWVAPLPLWSIVIELEVADGEAQLRELVLQAAAGD